MKFNGALGTSSLRVAVSKPSFYKQLPLRWDELHSVVTGFWKSINNWLLLEVPIDFTLNYKKWQLLQTEN